MGACSGQNTTHLSNYYFLWLKWFNFIVNDIFINTINFICLSIGYKLQTPHQTNIGTCSCCWSKVSSKTCFSFFTTSLQLCWTNKLNCWLHLEPKLRYLTGTSNKTKNVTKSQILTLLCPCDDKQTSSASWFMFSIALLVTAWIRFNFDPFIFVWTVPKWASSGSKEVRVLVLIWSLPWKKRGR